MKLASAEPIICLFGLRSIALLLILCQLDHPHYSTHIPLPRRLHFPGFLVICVLARFGQWEPLAQDWRSEGRRSQDTPSLGSVGEEELPSTFKVLSVGLIIK